MILFENLKRLMESRGLTQKDLARAIGGRQNTISTWFTSRKLPQDSTLVALAEYFQVSKEDLLQKRLEIEQMEPPSIQPPATKTLKRLEAECMGISKALGFQCMTGT